MNNNRDRDNFNGAAAALMKKIQSLAFAKVESELFLDTHPECRQALEYYKDVVRNLKEATEEYSAKYGPITATDVQGDKWTWANGGWPWHIKGVED